MSPNSSLKYSAVAEWAKLTVSLLSKRFKAGNIAGVIFKLKSICLLLVMNRK